MNMVVENQLLTSAVCTLLIIVEPFAIAGLALVNTGLGRSRSAAHAMTSALCIISVAFLVFFLWGFAVQGYPPQASHLSGFDPQSARTFFEGGSSPVASLYFLISIFSVGLASLIPSGAAADRLRLVAACISTIFFAGLIYPIFARLVWHSGLVTIVQSKMGTAFIDAAGSGFIQATGGLTGLSLSWVLGPRLGKYSANGMPNAIPAHSTVLVLFGSMLAWLGWLGLNSAGAILNAGTPLEKSPLVLINTTLCAAAAAVTSAVVTRVRFRKPDASLIANGWLGGLVASSAGCAILRPVTSVLTGFVAGALVVISVEQLEFRFKVDDPSGSISIHAVGGIWGLLAAGIFIGNTAQFNAQLVLVATLLGVVLPMSYALNWIMGRIIPHRVSAHGERQGMDLHELGADAYPEFVTHTDEWVQH